MTGVQTCALPILSYTTFAYSNLRLSAKEIKDTDTLTVTVTVTNTGKRFGKAVAQLYVGDRESTPIRPVRELKGFEKVALNPGESKDVPFTLDKRSFAYWNETIHDWHVETGDFTIEVGGSSRDLPLCDSVKVESTVELPRHYAKAWPPGECRSKTQRPNRPPSIHWQGPPWPPCRR